MTDPISIISGGITITETIFDKLNYIKNIAEANVISAYCKFDGNKVEGHDNINVELIKTETPEVFWLTVNNIKDYAFVHIPINDSGVHELIGTIQSESYPDSNIWRWVAKPEPGVIVGGNYTPPNAKVDFIVVGYRPKALIKHFS